MEFSKRAGLQRAVVLVSLLLIVVGGLVTARSMLRAASILCAFSERGAPFSVALYDRFFHYADTMTQVNVTGSGGEALDLRVYEPSGRRRPPTIIMLHGTAPNGNRTASLNRLAQAFVHQGFRVVLPTLPAETRYDMVESDLQVIADTVQWASKTAGGDTVSLFGASFGGGLAIPAAMLPAARGHVRLILDISGYNDLRSIARYYIHEPVVDPTGKPYPKEGPPGGAILFLKRYLDELVPPADVAPIREAVERALSVDRFPLLEGDPLLQDLSPEQRTRYVHLELVDTPEARQRYLALIARHDGDFTRVSPVSVMSQLDVPLYVLHATSDLVLPEGEVEALRSEIRPGADVHILLTPWMRHVTIRFAVPWWERLRVCSFFAQVLSQAAKR